MSNFTYNDPTKEKNSDYISSPLVKELLDVPRASLGRPLLRLVINVGKSEPRTVTFRPLPIVLARPSAEPNDRHVVFLDSSLKRVEVPAEVVDSIGIFDRLLDWQIVLSLRCKATPASWKKKIEWRQVSLEACTLAERTHSVTRIGML